MKQKKKTHKLKWRISNKHNYKRPQFTNSEVVS